MKISDLLRNLADKLDNAAPLQPHDEAEVGVFVSPLQQELELKKKEQGVENIFDDPEHSAKEQDDNQLTVIRRNAGIQ